MELCARIMFGWPAGSCNASRSAQSVAATCTSLFLCCICSLHVCTSRFAVLVAKRFTLMNHRQSALFMPQDGERGSRVPPPLQKTQEAVVIVPSAPACSKPFRDTLSNKQPHLTALEVFASRMAGCASLAWRTPLSQ